ncbi:unnamed protein product [Colias eurytheme]|nr:unnamed protein product [Colias eurytheme]
MLSKFTVEPGLNEPILRELKSVIQSLPAEKKLVTLLFDEISLAPGTEYNITTGQIIGFEDMGNDRRHKTLADHALVLMIKGIKSKSKQAISFTFCKSCTKASDLKEILTEAIKELQHIEFRVVATICDQASSNVKVIKMLQEDTKNKYKQRGIIYESNAFEIENMKVFPEFDTPHLLKGVRNNLLKKDAEFLQNGETKCAKWEHLKLLLDIDDGDDEIRLLNKLTEMHIIKEKIPKMKVKYAAQVFSQRVSSAMRFLARHNVLPEECKGTADFLLIFDKLFDTFNGHSYKLSEKQYKRCLKNNSLHFKLWDDLIPILESIKFKSVVRKNGIQSIKYESIPSVKNWVKNIKTFKELWHYLSTEHDIKSLTTRSFNQDPLENFFSGIRSNGIRNVNPSCNQFCNAFKTLIINNFNSSHSPRANCENDDNNAFKSMANLLNDKKCIDSNNDDFACDIDGLLNVMGQIKNNDKLVYAEAKKYVIGCISKYKCKWESNNEVYLGI